MPRSDIRAASGKQSTVGGQPDVDIYRSCAAVIEELKASRSLIGALEAENAALRSRLETEKQGAQLLEELNATRRSETDALRKALDAKNETIAAKDAVIAAQGDLIGSLKRKRTSPWKRALDVLIGIGVGAILK